MLILWSRIKVYLYCDKRKNSNRNNDFNNVSNFVLELISITIDVICIVAGAFSLIIIKNSSTSEAISIKKYSLNVHIVMYILLFIVLIYMGCFILFIFISSIEKSLIGASDVRVYSKEIMPNIDVVIHSRKYYIISTLNNDCYLSQDLHQIKHKSSEYEIISPDKNIFHVHCLDNLFKSKRKIKASFRWIDILFFIIDIIAMGYIIFDLIL